MYFRHVFTRIKNKFKNSFSPRRYKRDYYCEDEPEDIYCPYCGSDYFDDIRKYSQENHFKVISKCLNCCKYFVSEYCLIDVFGIDEDKWNNKISKIGFTRQGLVAS